MFVVEGYAAVRQFVFNDGKSRREAARVFGLSRETISKMCRFSMPPGYVRQRPPQKPKLGPLIPVIEAILESDRTAPVKQRHTAKRIHGFPERPLEQDLFDQSNRAAQRRDQAPHQCRRYLPQRGRHLQARRRNPARTERRMGGPEGTLHDAGNDRTVERYSNRRIARSDNLNNPARAGEHGDQAQLVTPRQWARSIL